MESLWSYLIGGIGITTILITIAVLAVMVFLLWLTRRID